MCGPWAALTCPLPKSHDQVAGAPVEVSVKVTDRGADPVAGVASNDATGPVPVTVGAAFSCAVALPDNARVWDPKTAPMNGVSRVMRPATATLIGALQAIASGAIWFGIVWLPAILLLVAMLLVARWVYRRVVPSLPSSKPRGPMAGWGDGA